MKQNFLKVLRTVLLSAGMLAVIAGCNKDNRNQGGSERIPIPEAIDLGLSVKWASFNIGASKPEELGNLYAWGETQTRDNFEWDNYKYGLYEYGNTTIYKYNTSSSDGMVDNKTVLGPEDDVAHVKLGGNWRMPTDAEFLELIENCSWDALGWCLRARSLKEGYTDKWILFPLGHRSNAYHGIRQHDSYWSSSLKRDNPYMSWTLYLITSNYYSEDNVELDGLGRWNGCPVRAVTQ